MAIYSNQNQEFQIVDFSATHSQLLLRSFKTKDREYNIDIIVKGVGLLLLPTSFLGIEISLLENKETISFLKDKFSFNNEYDNRIFSIKDNQGRVYYINALCFGVYHNKLDILETSIGRYDMESLGELEKWYAD
ncbi:hypothetical protein ZPR_3004 [Zunongwangia profunda SM-A87]|uniref:Uncharacterized protein n=1 Tax=Zunongwangia profunda (strain DSM 18752 / CCTCC AB 206139 / SM-A87) TaxID=655815 RepID=D5BHC5_ZUNPS|nr:hypothetical protein [Zunongwangia profunda]ADF53323.1 hypothetical protein ZPR_3004 [Zunongwangia profunda SM-A87]